MKTYQYQLNFSVAAILLILSYDLMAGINDGTTQTKTANSLSPAVNTLIAGKSDINNKDWLSAIQQDLRQREYHITWQSQTGYKDLPAAWQAPNRAHNFRTYFSQEGIRIVPRDNRETSWRWGLTLTGFGAADAFNTLSKVSPTVEANRISYKHEQITEWYVNAASGLEQGYTINSPPSAGVESITLAFAITGNMNVKLTADQSLILSTQGPGGVKVLELGQLHVFDAKHHALPAYFELASQRRLRLVVACSGAAYPITIDPLTTSAVWSAEGNQAEARFGYSVASAGDVNGDGYSDVLVGASQFDNGEVGEGAVFVYLGSQNGLQATFHRILEINLAGAKFGWSVSSAGDVNGDGYSDVIIGASEYSNNYTFEGAAFIYHGSASGLITDPAWIAEGGQLVAVFAYSVASAGDINGDNFSDVIIGARNFDNGEENEGAAFVYLGSVSGVSNSYQQLLEINQANAFFGSSVASAGDVNGDGFSDVIIGAPSYGNGEILEGAAFVYLGSDTGLSGNYSWSVEGNKNTAGLGGSVASAGDVNGDGFSDVIVGAPSLVGPTVISGAAYIYPGSASGVADIALWQVQHDQRYARYGISVASAGDVNGDGFSDVVVGASDYLNGEFNEGAVYVYFGSATGPSQMEDWFVESNLTSAELGVSVASAGDVDADGFSDLIVGAPNYENGEVREGKAFLYKGSQAGLSKTAQWNATSNQSYSYFGTSVASAGDVNGDGYNDVIVGAPVYDNGEIGEGAAFVYLGSASGLSTNIHRQFESNQQNAGFGSSVASAGDVNGDGYSDVIVGAYFYDNGQANEGAAFVYLGSLSGLSPSFAWSAESDQDNADFGYSVASAGDVNGDGYGDVIIGAHLYDTSEVNAGAVFIYLGSKVGLSPAYHRRLDGDQYFSMFGISVASAGDVNRDGYSDIIVGADNYNGAQLKEGAAFIYHGSINGISSNYNRYLEGPQANAAFGGSVASAGDVNGDGYSDVIVGARSYSNGESSEGVAIVYHGSSNGIVATPAWSAESNQDAANFGHAVASAGDVNGDGYSDVVVGAYRYDGLEIDEGAAFVYLGSSSGLSPVPSWVNQGGQNDARYGYSVASAGDVNGDGYSDLIIGARRYDGDVLSGLTDEGAAFVYYGNNGVGKALNLRQLNLASSTLISSLGMSDSFIQFRYRIQGYTPFGRGDVKLQWEVKPLATKFNGSGLQQSANWIDSGIAGGVITEQVSGLSENTVYHWRARLLYRKTLVPYQAASRWITSAANGLQEADLRTRAEADLSLTIADNPDPVVEGDNVSYTITIDNNGPHDAVTPQLYITLPSGANLVSSSAVCKSDANLHLTCDLPGITAGSHITGSYVLTAPVNTDLMSLTASVSTTSIDRFVTNNSGTEWTVVQVPNIPPVAQDGTLAVSQDVAANGILHASDANQDALTYSIVAQGSLGIVVITDALNGTYTYTPNPGASGSDSFSFKANDGVADSNVAIVSVTIQALSSKPQSSDSGSSSCFIATAAYGSPLHNEVRYLRAFRDQYLLSNEPGRYFVRWYYRNSPPLADFLRQQASMRQTVRTLLTPVVWLSKQIVDEEVYRMEH